MSAGRPLSPEEFSAAMARLGPQVYEALRLGLLRYCLDFAMGTVPRLVVQNLHNRRGQSGLAGSFRAEPFGSGDDAGVAVFTHSPYARLQEEGGTVTAKGRMLAIPVGQARTAAGVTRGNPRAWPESDTFVGKTPGGHLAIMLRNRDGSADPIFLLRRQVTVPPRLGVMAAWDAGAQGRNDLLSRAATLALDRGD